VRASSVISQRLSNQLASKQASSKQAIARLARSSSSKQPPKDCLRARGKLSFAC